MPSQSSRWRKTVIAFALCAGGLGLLVVAVETLNGVMFFPNGGYSKGGPPNPWQTVGISSPIVQLSGAICFSAAGAILFWLAYKTLKAHKEHR
jgi:hypothetical protein